MSHARFFIIWSVSSNNLELITYKSLNDIIVESGLIRHPVMWDKYEFPCYRGSLTWIHGKNLKLKDNLENYWSSCFCRQNVFALHDFHIQFISQCSCSNQCKLVLRKMIISAGCDAYVTCSNHVKWLKSSF